MKLQEPNHLVTFLTSWATAAPWTHPAIAGNEHELCESIFPETGTAPECDQIWKRVFSMRLSAIAGSGWERRRRTKTDKRWDNCAASSKLGAALRTGGKWNLLGERYGAGIALLVKLPKGFVE